MRIAVKRTLAGTGIAAVLALGAPGLAAADPVEPAPKPSAAEMFFKALGPAPKDCEKHWDVVEDAVKKNAPEWSKEWVEAFDDWCEGDKPPAEEPKTETPA